VGGWADAAIWTGGGVRREVFHLPSGSDLLYGSLYASDLVRGGPRFVICPSWGSEFVKTQGFCHRLARFLVDRGGAGMVFHWPGQGDSTGVPEKVNLDRLAQAVVDVLEAMVDRSGGGGWGLAGIRLGAAAAALAATAGDAAALLLLEPVLDPGGYLDEVRRSARRARLRRDGEPGWAFGHPVPAGLGHAMQDVTTAATSFPGPRAVARYGAGGAPPLKGFDTLTVSGSWRSDSRHDHQTLARVAADWAAGTGEAA
jgi:hypothetical protein